MESFKTFGSLFLAMISCFTLGGYTYASVRSLVIIDIHRWVLTSLFGLMFLVYFLISYHDRTKN
jgi:hypothetical protein